MPEKNEPEPSCKRIVFLDRNSLPDRFIIRPPTVRHEWINYSSTPPELAIQRCSGADVLVTNKVKISEQLLLSCPRVKHIAVAATGFNIVDTAAATKLGVSVSNIPSYATTTVAEHVITSALCLRRELLSYRQSVIQGDWQSSPTFCLFGKPLNDINNATFGVIGLGDIGTATARMAASLGMNVIYSARRDKACAFAKRVSFDDLISTSDIISVHCSLRPETEGLISARELKKMKSHAILINTARGGIVNETDVVDAIKNDIIGGLSFDVLAHEPPLEQSPVLSIATRDNVIVTPHTAWASEQAIQSLVDILADNINDFLLGSAQNIVN